MTDKPKSSGRVDIHAHFVPDFYRSALIEAGHARPDGMPGIPEWTPEAALAFMDGLSIGKAILSISSPGVHFGDDLSAADLARAVNAEGARLRREYPDRFGFFAALPLPDVQRSVAEAVHALGELEANLALDIGISVDPRDVGALLL